MNFSRWKPDDLVRHGYFTEAELKEAAFRNAVYGSKDETKPKNQAPTKNLKGVYAKSNSRRRGGRRS